MYTKKPKYNVQLRVFRFNENTVDTKVQYFDEAFDASTVYLMMMKEHRHNVPEDTVVHYKLRTASTVLAQFWMARWASMESSPDKRIAQEYKAAEQYLASKEMEAA